MALSAVQTRHLAWVYDFPSMIFMRLSFSSSSSSFWFVPSSCPLEQNEVFWRILRCMVGKFENGGQPTVIFYCLNRALVGPFSDPHGYDKQYWSDDRLLAYYLRTTRSTKKNARAWRAIVANLGEGRRHSLLMFVSIVCCLDFPILPYALPCYLEFVLGYLHFILFSKGPYPPLATHEDINGGTQKWMV